MFMYALVCIRIYVLADVHTYIPYIQSIGTLPYVYALVRIL